MPIYALGLAGPIAGSGTLIPVLVAAMGLTWGYFIHANVRWRLGPLEWIVSTPAFHHWHHTKSGPIDKNFASTLPWLDRIFGTHHLPDHLPDDYGIKAEVPESLIGQLGLPLSSRAPSLQSASRAEGGRIRVAEAGVPSSRKATDGPIASEDRPFSFRPGAAMDLNISSEVSSTPLMGGE